MEATNSSSLRIWLFGEFRTFLEGEQVTFPTRKAASLFAFLLLKRGQLVAREQVIAALWPDEEEDRGRRNLSTSLWRMRQALVDVSSWVSVYKDAIGIQSINAEVDLFQFQDLLARRRLVQGEALRSVLELAEGLYRGDLARTLSEECFEEERRSARLAYVGVLRELATVCIEGADYDSSIRKLEIIVRLEPLDEDAHRELMRVQYLAGKREAALAQYDLLKQSLQTELDTSPSTPTVQLYEHISNSRKWVTPRESKKGVEPKQADTLHDVPIVGRGPELSRMAHHLDLALAGRGSAVIVCGDLGIGKTKLIQAVTEEARLRGFEVLHGACPDLETAPPYQVILQALWPRLQKKSLLADKLGAVVDRLVESISLTPGLRSQASETYPSVSASLLNEYILSLLSDSQPHWPATILTIEDIHRIDAATEGLLLSLLGRLSKMRVYVVLSLRRGEGEWERIRTAFLTAGAEALDLEPLTRQEIPRLLEGALGRIVPMTRVAEYTYQRAAGVPLFTIELLKFLMGEGYLRRRLDGGYAFDERALTVENLRIPTRILEIVRERIARLESRAQILLSNAAVIGTDVPYELLARLLGVPEDKYVEIAETLLARRLLLESDRCFIFPHESVRTAALSLLSGARRRKLHSKTAELLESLAPAKAGEIAWHYSEAGSHAKAAHFFEVAGDRARSIRANEDAVRSYSQAIGSVGALEQSEEAQDRRLAGLLLKRQEVLDLVGNRDAQAKDIDALLAIALRLQDQSLVGHGLYLRSQVLSRMNRNSEALQLASEAEQLFRESRDIRGAAKAAESIGLAFINLRNQRKAKGAFSRSLKLFLRAGDRMGEARALANIGTALALAGDNSGSIRSLDQAERILREFDDTRGLAGVLLQKGVLYRYLGCGVRSTALLISGIRLMEEVGDKVGEARGRSQLACTKATMGELRDGLREAIHAIRLAKEANDVRARIVFMNNAAYSNLRSLGQFRKAEAFVNQAMRLVADGIRPENAAIYYDTMAAILLDKGDSEGALRWCRQALTLYRRWQGHFDYVGDDIAFHIGLSWVRLGRHDQALPHLTQCVANWRRRGDLGQLAHGVAALGELWLLTGSLSEALECAREVERLLRRIEGTEQVQRVLWIQHRIYAASGARTAARRALRKALAAVLDQAEPLKGRLKRQFMTGVAVNKEVIATAERSGLMAELESGAAHPATRLDTAVRIDQRRRAILELMAKGALDRKLIANRFGVSLRTIRNDLAALRQKGTP